MSSRVKPLSESLALGFEAVGARRVAIAVRKDSDNPSIDLALVLAVDVSGSVSTERLTLQFQGYSEAFAHPDLAQAVKHGRQGRIATTFVEWSDSGRQYQAVDWRLIDSEETVRAFGKAIADAIWQNPGWTSISAYERGSATCVDSDFWLQLMPIGSRLAPGARDRRRRKRRVT